MEVIRKEMERMADGSIAEHSARFFKSGPGEYGEGDRFRGIRVPVLRRLAKKHRTASLEDVERLLQSEYHEDRLLALLILVLQYQRGGAAERDRIYRMYLSSTARINSWDLVDTSAEHIVGAHLEDGDRSVLHELAASESLWERRIAMLSTFRYIKCGEFSTALEIAERLVGDEHDLIHKAVGWMLREIGSRDMAVEEAFLKAHYRRMPRTMLRYAIEKFPPERRRKYLEGHI